MTTSLPARRLAGAALLTAMAVVAAGCKGEKPVATVSGKVTYNGKPLTVGYVNFLSTTGSAVQIPLDEGGGFKSDGPLDVGEYKVYLGAPIPGQSRGTKAAPTAKYTVTPKFQSPASSGVKATLAQGPNDIPLDIKD